MVRMAPKESIDVNGATATSPADCSDHASYDHASNCRIGRRACRLGPAHGCWTKDFYTMITIKHGDLSDLTMNNGDMMGI